MPENPHKVRNIIIVGILALAVIAVSLTAGLGGFADRTDWRINIDPGTTVDINMVEIRVLDAQAMEPVWEGGPWYVTVRTDVRNLSNEPLEAWDFFNAIAYLYTNDTGDKVQTDWALMNIMTSSDSGEYSPRKIIPPGSDFLPVEFTITADGFVVEDGLWVGLIPVLSQDTAVLGLSDSYTWSQDPNADHYWMVKLPVKVVEY